MQIRGDVVWVLRSGLGSWRNLETGALICAQITPAPPTKSESKVIQQLEAGRLKGPINWFLNDIRRREGIGDRQAFSEDIMWILDQLFWHALHIRQSSTAAFLVRQIRQEAKRRRILWALV